MTSSSSSASTAVRAADFIGSIGVNTHIAWTGTAWGNWGNVEAELAYTGIKNVRAEVPYAGWTLPEYEKLAASGVKFDISLTGPTIDIAGDLQKIAALEVAAPGSVASIEGSNEFNVNTLSLNGVSSYGNAAWGAQLDAALSAAVRANPIFAQTKVIAASFSNAGAQQIAAEGDVSASVDASNWHEYFGNGAQPASGLASAIALATSMAPTKPVYITESGYYTAIDAMDWGGGGVSEVVQAKLTLNLLLDAYQEGASKTFLYELMDNINNPASDDLEDSFGLFHGDGTPKLAATALHNLTTLLADSGATASSFATTALPYTLVGQTAADKSMLLQKSDGSYDLVLWNEQPIWNESTKSEITPAAHTVQLDLSGPAAITIYDPLTGTTAVQSYSSATQASVAITDHAMIITIKPITAAAVPPSVAITSQTLAHDTGSSATDNVTSNGTVTLSGTAAGTGVGVTILDNATPISTVVPKNGTWTFTTTLGSGSHVLSAVATDSVGNKATAASQPTINVVTSPPVVTVTGEVPGATTDSEVLTGTVSGAPGTTVQLSDGTKALGPATLDGKGGWSYTGTFTPGTHNILAVATDPAGNTASVDPPFTVPSAKPSDSLVLNLSEDAYKGDAQFTVSVDGQQVGGVQSVTALQNAGQSQAFSFTGQFGTGAHVVAVNFLNDAWGGTAATDRNLYVNSIVLDGTTTLENAEQTGQGIAHYATPSSVLPTLPSAAVPNSPTPPSTLVLGVAEDAYNGNAQFTVSVDGQQVGGIQTVTALRSSGQTQLFTVTGNFAAGAHDVAVTFLNDAYGGTAANDRNLYVNSVSLNGNSTVEHGVQLGQGTVHYKATANAASTASNALQILPGGTLILDPAAGAHEQVTFAGSNAALQLSAAPSFSGSISGFGTGDTIDLRSVSFGSGLSFGYAKQANASGVLTVMKGAQTAALSMIGNYASNSFSLASDGQGGTLVGFTGAHA